MANRDLANGFEAVGTLSGAKLPGPTAFNSAGGQTWKVGAVARLVSGQAVNPTTTAGSLLGVVAPQQGIGRLGSTCIASATTNQDVMIYAGDDIVFQGQSSGTATSVMVGLLCDWVGAAGAQEVATATSTESVFCVRELVVGPTESRGVQAIGANSLVRFTIAKCQVGAHPDSTT